MTEPNGGIVSHPQCAKSWKQRGNRTGHCARCCETFEGLDIFDRHQTILPNGRVECRDPRTIKVHREPLRLEDGTWRGPGMDAAAVSRPSLGGGVALNATLSLGGIPVPSDVDNAEEGRIHIQSGGVP